MLRVSGFSRLLLILLLLVSAISCHSKEDFSVSETDELKEISYVVISGKPGAPAEKITLLRIEGQCFFSVQRFQNVDQILNEEKIPVDCHYLSSAWIKVVTDGLLTYSAETKSDSVYDFGERNLDIKWVSKNTPDNLHRINWMNELESDSKLVGIVELLVNVYREQSQKLSFQLHYLK